MYANPCGESLHYLCLQVERAAKEPIWSQLPVKEVRRSLSNAAASSPSSSSSSGGAAGLAAGGAVGGLSASGSSSASASPRSESIDASRQLAAASIDSNSNSSSLVGSRSTDTVGTNN
jgi:hypothetical protein